MPLVCEKLRDEKPGAQTKGYETTELWECYSANADGSVNENGLVDPVSLIDDPLLPKIGSPHPNLTSPNFSNAILVEKVVTQVVANWSVIVALIYRGWGVYSGGPRPISYAYNVAGEVVIPIWRKRTDGAVFWWEKDHDTIVPRATAVRQETRFLGGDQVAAVQRAIARNIGSLYELDGDWYTLSPRTSALFSGGTYTRADYRFERSQAMPAIAAQDTNFLLGNDAEIPALPALFTWTSYPDPNAQTSGDPPIIAAVPPIALTGFSLPGFP